MRMRADNRSQDPESKARVLRSAGGWTYVARWRSFATRPAT